MALAYPSQETGSLWGPGPGNRQAISEAMRNNTPTDTRPDQAQPGPHVHFTGPFALTTEADPENEAPNSNRPSACAAPGKHIIKMTAGTHASAREESTRRLDRAQRTALWLR